MSFLYVWYFVQHFTTHCIRPHFILEMFVSDLYKLQFFFFSFLHLLYNLSQTFINAYKLYFVLVHNAHIATVEG